jgi:hypothetical protein
MLGRAQVGPILSCFGPTHLARPGWPDIVPVESQSGLVCKDSELIQWPSKVGKNGGNVFEHEG